MKKFLFLTSWLLIAGTIYSQGYTVLLSQNFSNTSGWSSNENNGSPVNWGVQTNNVETPDYGPISFIDSSQDYHFASIIADGATGNINTDLLSPAINCTGQSAVLLQFTQWFAYLGYSDGKVEISTNGTTWTTVYDAVQSSTGANDEVVDVDISSYAANKTAVYLKFNYTTTGADLFWAIDNITVTSYPVNDVAVTQVNETSVTNISNQYAVNCTFVNQGSATLNSVTLNYSINGSTPVSENITNLEILPFQAIPYTFQTIASVTQAGTFPVVVYSSLPNGVQDDNTSNDTTSLSVIFLSSIPQKNVLLEEYTTAPCGYCPGAEVDLGKTVAVTPYVIPVALHTGFDPQGDPLATDAIITFGDSMTPGESPLAAVDRVLFPNNDWMATGIQNLGSFTSSEQQTYGNQWALNIFERHNQMSPVGIVASNQYDSATRQVNVSIFPTFYGAMTGNFRVGCYIVEDSLVGAQITYYYSSPANTAINPLYEVGEYNSNIGEYEIPNFVWNYVVRDCMGAKWGWGSPTFGEGITTPSVDSSYVQSFTYTLPQNWNDQHISLVAFVDEYNSPYQGSLVYPYTYAAAQDQVLNSVRMKLGGLAEDSITTIVLTGVDNVTKSTDKVSLYPNPATNQAYINYSIDEPGRVGFVVYNSLGQVVSVLNESTLSQGSYTAVLNTESYANGVYFLTMKKDNATLQTTKFVISR